VRFYKISSIEPVVDYLFQNINERLESRQKVLWLVAGGSAIKVAAKVAKRLQTAKNLDHLIVSLTDERYGPIDHPDSNWLQLKQAGFDLPGAKLQLVLDGKSLEETAERYSQLLADDFKTSDYRLGFIGVGPDSHIAGIKPHSPAVDSDQMAEGYKWEDFERLTMTAKAIVMLDEVVSYMMGEAKHGVIKQLDQELTLQDQPAQILKKVKEVTIFNDFKGEELR